jgi:amidase
MSRHAASAQVRRIRARLKGAQKSAPRTHGPSDFAGSLRTPAAFCGVLGLRTTAGIVPKHPAAVPWHDQSVAGPMA